MNKRFLTIIISIILLTAISILGIKKWQNTQNNTISDKRLLAVILRDKPTLSHDGKPIIQITSATQPVDGWYIATITSIHSTNDFVPVRVIIRSDTTGERVVLGPDTHFTKYQQFKYNIPDAVMRDLEKS